MEHYSKLARLVNSYRRKPEVGGQMNVPFERCLLQPYSTGTSHLKSQDQ